jgi:hypothetical protein
VAELSTAEATARQAGALCPGSAEFRTAAAAAPAEYQLLLRRLVDWAEHLDASGLVSLATYCGKNEVVTLLPRLRSDNAGLATIYLEPEAAYIQLWPTVFKRRAPNTVTLVEQELGKPIRNGQRIHAPSEELLRTLTAAYHEATGKPGTPATP